MSDDEDPSPPVNAVGFTSQITAAFRAVELAHSTEPIIRDPLAPLLGKDAWHTALADWQQLVEEQGPGKSLRVPARNRLVDDLLLQALQQLRDAGCHTAVQVVNIGCGMDSKPWRLQTPLPVSFFDVDQPAVLELKQHLLREAGAALSPAPPAASPFPLVVSSWQPVAADLSQAPLAGCLNEGRGFDLSCPTVWLAEALLYYLPLDKAQHLLANMRALSAPGSSLVATCIDRELHVADHQRLDKGHYFHALWHFSLDQLLERLGPAGWAVDMQPRTSADLARERYGRATYVPAYGGAELVFTATAGCQPTGG